MTNLLLRLITSALFLPAAIVTVVLITPKDGLPKLRPIFFLAILLGILLLLPTSKQLTAFTEPFVDTFHNELSKAQLEWSSVPDIPNTGLNSDTNIDSNANINPNDDAKAKANDTQAADSSPSPSAAVSERPKSFLYEAFEVILSLLDKVILSLLDSLA